MAQKDLFEIFSSSSKEEWLAKVEKDLKGRPLEELNWQLEEGINLPPFYHPDDISLKTEPIANFSPTDNDWEIGEYIKVTDPKIANQQLLEGLKGGVEAPLLLLENVVESNFLALLFKEVEHAYISTHIRITDSSSDVLNMLDNLILYCKETDKDFNALKGSLNISAYLESENYDASSFATFLKKGQQLTPLFKLLSVDASKEYRGLGHTTAELAATIRIGERHLYNLLSAGIDEHIIGNQLFFNVSIGKSYFVEIAKVRALKILWANVLKAYNLTIQSPHITAHLATKDREEEVNMNMIKASTQALSATVAGVQQLYIPPANWAEEATSFTRRIARNVQHLLKMESHLHRVIDPAAGSYYIENLTQQFVDKAWSKFAESE